MKAHPLLAVTAIALAVLLGIRLADRMRLPWTETRPPSHRHAHPAVIHPGLLAGHARVIDGDTLEVDGRRVRLFGIDAPEAAQHCDRAGTPYACGEAATRYLRALIGGQTVQCRPRDTDQYGRTVAVCSIGGQDLNAAMVRAGWALAYRHYANDYVGAEAAARGDSAGLWAGRFEPPWEWRHERR